MRTVALIASTLLLFACRGEAPAAAQQLDQVELDALIDSLIPSVERAAGMTFKERPKAAVRTKDQVRTFLLAKLADELPPERLEGLSAAYRLLGLLPDTLDLGAMFVDLYTEQIAGFYEPDSLTLYAVGGSSPLALRGILSHELVHALQHQYIALDSILDNRDDADRLAAAQAVLEGQATLVMVLTLSPDPDVLANEDAWSLLRAQLSGPAEGLDVFNNAPTVIRTGLVFPYLEGASFMRSFMLQYPGQQPFGSLMPQSTEQILHPDRLTRNDAPIALRFDDDTTGVSFEDTFGEYEMLVLRSVLAGIAAIPTDVPLNWGGDRMRAYRTLDGPALVWYSVWDDQAGATNFADHVAAGLLKLKREGYRTTITELPIGPRAGVQVVIAPAGWVRWGDLPVVTIRD
ncbi:MAG: hypothetical protein ABI542_07410 [Gemmatimonadota bacterium]